MSILAELTDPMPVEDFRRHYFGREPYAAPGKAARFRKLIGWELVLEILDSRHPDCWLPKNGKLPNDPDLNAGHFSAQAALRAFEQDGRTILIRHSERAHRSLAAIADDFRALFNRDIDIQLYGTPAGEEGFDWHYDAEDVFVIQSSGMKEFRLRKNTGLAMRPRTAHGQDVSRLSEGPELSCLLAAGDWLYIPAGYWHKARALTPSFHLSVGVMMNRMQRRWSAPLTEVSDARR